MMILNCGNKLRFAICMQVENVHDQQIWGGFEFWINNKRFGDINYFDLISANDYHLIERIANGNIPDLPFAHMPSSTMILNYVNSLYYGNPIDDLAFSDLNKHLSKKEKIIESYEKGKFWGMFILLPNGSIPFDYAEMIFYNIDSGVNVIYKQDSRNDVVADSFAMPSEEFKSVAQEFLVLFDDILKGKMNVSFVDRSLFY